MRAGQSLRWLFLVFGAATSCGNAASDGCDAAQLKLTCRHPNGQCVEFSGLSTADEQANAGGCDPSGTPCPAEGRLGTCNIPPNGARTGVQCSPNAVINIRYFAPFAQGEAQSLCQGVPGAVWTPN